MKKPSVWTADDIKKLRKRYGETQAKFCLRFPVAVITLKCWEGGAEPSSMACTILDRLEEDLETGRVRQLQTA